MSTSPFPVVDETYAQRIFAALTTMEVSLDADPIAHGPKRMNAKIAVCRNHLDRCQQIFLQTSNDLHVLNRALRVAKVEFDLRMQDMLTNDPETRAGRSVRDREAIATMKLRDEREAMATIESSISDLDAVMVVVKAKRDDLKDILGRIRDQLKLCQEEIGLGSRWGTAPAPGQSVPSRSAASGIDPSVLAMMDTIPGEAEMSISDISRIVHETMAAQSKADSEVDSTPAPEQLPDPPAEIAVDVAPAAPVPTVYTTPAPSASEPSKSGVDADFDSFLSDMDDGSSKPNPTPAQAADIDLDDLIGSLS